MGDRSLAIFMGRGYYHFTTYNIGRGKLVESDNIEYGGDLEGVWSFIYFSFDQDVECATGLIRFPGGVRRVSMNNIRHKPLNDYVVFRLGRQFNYLGVNGIIQRLNVILGEGSYVGDEESLGKLIQTMFPQPQSVMKKPKEYKIEEKKKEWLDGETFDYSEYAIVGWFKQSSDKQESGCQLMFRLSNNAVLGDVGMGDRTLSGFYCNDLYFSTYSMSGGSEQSNIVKRISVGEYEGLWLYVYFGYSRELRSSNVLVHYLDSYATQSYENVEHYVPNYLGLYVGEDGIQKPFSGKFKDVYLMFGSFINVMRRDIAEKLPYFLGNRKTVKAEWNDDDKMIITPSTEERIESTQPPGVKYYAREHEFTNEEVEGATEYSVSMWTRWLMTYPQRILIKDDLHSIFRLADRNTYSDAAYAGDRVLSAFVAKYNYQFSTYDKITQHANVISKIPYHLALEGSWNLIYFAYRKSS